MTSTQVTEFEALRPHLMAVAYRLTGTVADAEDIVQEAWLRWDAQERSTIADLRAWLTTVVSRLGLDRLRSAAHRRETYTGNWLPEPVVTGFDDADPLSAVVAARGCPVRGDGGAGAAVARTSGSRSCCTTGSRCRSPKWPTCWAPTRPPPGSWRRGPARPSRRSPPPKPDPSHNEVVGKLMAAMAAGDLDAVVALLHPDVTLTGDANGKASTAIHVIHGADKVARFMFGLARRYGPAFFTANQLALINGELGAYTAGCPGSDGHRDDVAADHGHDGARRKGLRHMGCRQPRQVHRLSAA